MRTVVFIRDMLNKHSVRSLLAAFETHYPNREYHVLKADKFLSDFSDDAIVLCSFATGRSEFYYDYAKQVRQKKGRYSLACGGPHPSARPEMTAELFDTVCVGEGEYALKEIIDHYDATGGGLGVIKGKRVEDLDIFPAFPRRNPELGPIEIMRGCISACRYCQTPQLFNGRIRYRSVESVAKEIKFGVLCKKMSVDARFIAPDATAYYLDKTISPSGVNLSKIEELLSVSKDAVGKGGRLFYGTFPSEIYPAGVNQEFVDLIKKYTDNELIVVGLQSASNRMLSHMNRRQTADDTSRTVELFLNAGYKVVVDFIFGLPGEDEQSVDETVRWIERWRNKVVIHAHPFDPLPGSIWEHENPTAVPERLMKLLKSLEGKAGIFGRVTNDTPEIKEQKCQK